MTSPTDAPPSRYPGERIGLPESGPGSVARLGRRVAGLFLDWFIALGLSWAVFHQGDWVVYPVFALLQILAIWALGGSIGHRVFGLRLSALPGYRPAFWRPIVRSVLLTLVIPALVWDSDQRGFHDKVAGTVLIRA
ncbi:RDD family protein [Gryllotalpicola ginsengisoli]|uniref:RDD family protein n=1 Tax=Gryllotalpicola ginsengisoli TaxID=444608 RepID=UPI0003B535AC|nr:RDD family protein [Gryllotalpicola ginsengisoli]